LNSNPPARRQRSQRRLQPRRDRFFSRLSAPSSSSQIEPQKASEDEDENEGEEDFNLQLSAFGGFRYK
jgi:hypothetical protein